MKLPCNLRPRLATVLMATSLATTVAAAAILSGVTPSLSQAEGSPTVIYESLLIGEEACAIEIVSAPLSICEGTSTQYTAILECGEGLNPINDPQWFLDGEPVGTGLSVSLELAEGTYSLEVACGSCEDAVTVEAIDCTFLPRLEASHIDDASEADAGVYVRKNISAVNPLNFSSRRLLMHPFSLSMDESATSGFVELTLEGSQDLELYALDGTELSLPLVWNVEDLPVEFLVNGVEFGASSLRASYAESAPFRRELGERADIAVNRNRSASGGPLVDEVLVRVSPWPGLSGKGLASHPFFHWVDSFNDNEDLHAALDPHRHAGREGNYYDVYVVESKTPTGWASDATLVDVTGSVEAGAVIAESIADNVETVWTGGLDVDGLVSKNYDIVYDFNQNGVLDPGDLIDGFQTDGAGAYAVKDLSLGGPHSVSTSNHSGGTWLTQRVYYPSDIASMGEVPLVTIGHGNGHQHTWYAYLGNHLASHGYVVMSYRNNTGPGIETASTTTLTNMDYFFSALGGIAGGALVGHIDNDRIGWIGHSRGGEGIVRAYDRLYDGAWTPNGYQIEGVRTMGSIAPTVYLLASQSDPHDQNYYLIVGAADGDVTGRPDLDGDQYFRIPDRSLGTSLTTYVHGASHNDFNCCGFDDAIGPAQIGRTRAQVVAKSYFLALMQHYLDENPATQEYFTRMYDDLSPSGIDPIVEIASTYRVVGSADNFVIDDFQTESSLSTSSSGGTVTMDVGSPYEGENEDNNSTYTWTTSDPMNGMTMFHGDGDFSRGLVFDHSSGENSFVEYEVIPAYADVRSHRYVSFRACQATRHPETVGLDGSHSFSVTLRDAAGATSTVPFGSWGELTDLYARSGSGSGSGWLSEMNTVRIPLAAFELGGAGLDLSQIVALRFEFGDAFGSERGRIGMDDIQFVGE